MTLFDTVESIRALPPQEQRATLDEMKHDLALHTADFWTCRPCMVIAQVEGRR